MRREEARRREEEEANRPPVRWWHEWMCGCGEGSDRGGDNQVGFRSCRVWGCKEGAERCFCRPGGRIRSSDWLSLCITSPSLRRWIRRTSVFGYHFRGHGRSRDVCRCTHDIWTLSVAAICGAVEPSTRPRRRLAAAQCTTMDVATIPLRFLPSTEIKKHPALFQLRCPCQYSACRSHPRSGALELGRVE